MGNEEHWQGPHPPERGSLREKAFPDTVKPIIFFGGHEVNVETGKCLPRGKPPSEARETGIQQGKMNEKSLEAVAIFPGRTGRKRRRNRTRAWKDTALNFMGMPGPRRRGLQEIPFISARIIVQIFP
jgi:hypothetical protein